MRTAPGLNSVEPVASGTLRLTLYTPTLLSLALVIGISVVLPSPAQINPLTTVHGTVDQGIVLPQPMPLSGRQDAAALIELRAYRTAVGAGTWTDMVGKGNLTTGGANAVPGNDADPATLWILGHNGFRLDVQKQKGLSSVRMDGTYGIAQHEDGKIKPMDARDAVTGLLAFPSLFEANFPTAQTMLTDQGFATVDGTTLRRISVETSWPDGETDASGASMTAVTDLYFDPQTHLLIKSATAVLGSDVSPEQYLRVVTYGDYRATDGMQIPYRYSETLNGQSLWTLQLSHIQLNQGLSQASFHF